SWLRGVDSKGSSLNSHPCRVRWSVSVPLRIQHGVQLVAVGTVSGQSQFYTLSSGEATALHHQHRATCGQTKESGVGRVADPGLDGLFPGIQQDVVLVFQYFVERALGEIDFLQSGDQLDVDVGAFHGHGFVVGRTHPLNVVDGGSGGDVEHAGGVPTGRVDLADQLPCPGLEFGRADV